MDHVQLTGLLVGTPRVCRTWPSRRQAGRTKQDFRLPDSGPRAEEALGWNDAAANLQAGF